MMNLPFINLMISSGIKIWCKQDQSPVFGFFKLELREENLEDTFAELPGWALLLKKTYFKEQNKYVWRSGGKRLIIPMIMYILTLNYVYNVYFKWSENAQSCPTLCNPMDCSLPGPPVQWNSPGQNTGVGTVPFSRASSQPRHQTHVSCTAGGFFTVWAILSSVNISHCYFKN